MNFSCTRHLKLLELGHVRFADNLMKGNSSSKRSCWSAVNQSRIMFEETERETRSKGGGKSAHGSDNTVLPDFSYTE